MPLHLGSSAVSLKLGTQSVTGYLGGQNVTATVPGAPVITEAGSQGIGAGEIIFTAPADGGLPINGYNVYVNESSDPEGGQYEPVGGSLVQLNFEPGDTVRIAAVNAIGEGPKSNSATAL